MASCIAWQARVWAIWSANKFVRRESRFLPRPLSTGSCLREDLDSCALCGLAALLCETAKCGSRAVWKALGEVAVPKKLFTLRSLKCRSPRQVSCPVEAPFTQKPQIQKPTSGFRNRRQVSCPSGSLVHSESLKYRS